MVRFKSKEELLAYLKEQDLIGLDSEWSRQSLALVKQFGAKEMDINRWWVLTPTNWTCPCCRREKSEIVRVNAHGHLMGEIHEHHDHVGDTVRREFTKASESLPEVLADSSAERFFKRIAIGFTAYDKTLVCSDCNEADWKAKELVGLRGSDFSFSPFEIGLFVLPSPNLPHKIDKDNALSAWQAAKPMFDMRMGLIQKIAKLAATDSHWYQPVEKSSKREERQGEIWIRHNGLDKPPFGGIPEQWLYKTNKHSGKANSWRFKLHSADSAPTEGEVAHMGAFKAKKYFELPEDWRCDICHRHKYQSIRKANSGEWNFDASVRRKYVKGAYVEEFKFCKDCKDVATSIGKEVKERDMNGNLSSGPLNTLISRSDLERVVQAKAHCKHHIDNKVADEVVEHLLEQVRQGGGS